MNAQPPLQVQIADDAELESYLSSKGLKGAAAWLVLGMPFGWAFVP
jgi:hypothetical protein